MRRSPINLPAAPQDVLWGCTAYEVYAHIKHVNAYYFGETGVDAGNEGSIAECRTRGFALLEQTAGYLTAPVREGSYGEFWSVRKMLRRFLWHDRIHAKALYRMAVRTFGADAVEDFSDLRNEELEKRGACKRRAAVTGPFCLHAAGRM